MQNIDVREHLTPDGLTCQMEHFSGERMQGWGFCIWFIPVCGGLWRLGLSIVRRGTHPSPLKNHSLTLTEGSRCDTGRALEGFIARHRKTWRSLLVFSEMKQVKTGQMKEVDSTGKERK